MSIIIIRLTIKVLLDRFAGKIKYLIGTVLVVISIDIFYE